MCGIVGYFGDGLCSSLLDRLLSSMERRGPDGEGRFVDGSLHMGMRRLSIIDLAHGWQPFESAGGNVIAFQNGEIYNFKALRRALEADGATFHTNSDTEVIAHGYARWGIRKLLSNLDGMFALAIFDKVEQKLHLARDRFGEKPLFYSRGPGVFGYGSTLLSVASMPWVKDDFDPLSLNRYLAVHYVPGDRTIFKDIQQLLPGERLEFDIRRQQVFRQRYYTPNLTRQSNLSEDELAATIEEAVESRLISDVPVGVFLSGGIDSSVIAAIAAKKNSRIATFSMGFPEVDFDESKVAADVARHIGSEHHSFIFNENNFPVLMKEVAASMDTPVGDQALLPVYWLSKEAKNYVTVVLSGEGGDEVFGGYSYYQKFYNALRAQSKTPVQKLIQIAERFWSKESFLSEKLLATPSGFPLMIGEKDRAALLEGHCRGSDAWEQDFLGWLSNAKDSLQRATAADLGSWLADDLLVKLDRMTMAHSLEGRAPYLSANVVEAGLSLNPESRYASESKVALRSIAKRYVPADVVNRPKQGFCLPMKQWLLDWFDLHGGVRPYFKARPIPSIKIDVLCNMIEWDVQHGIVRDRFVFAIVMFAEWWSEFATQRDRVRSNAATASERYVA